MVFGQALFAQDTIKTFIISEARLQDTHRAYVEFTNMGTTAIDLKKFRIGQIGGGATLINGKSSSRSYDLFPAKMLQPGESFVFASISDYEPKMYAKGNYKFGERSTPENEWSEIDVQMHIPNMPGNNVSNALDSISKDYSFFNELWTGQTGIFLLQKLNNGDSCVVDQVGGMYLDAGGKQFGRGPYVEGYDVAGFTGATHYAFLIRKFSVKKGNLNFAAARGVGLDDSEWIPIPMVGGATGWRMVPWTLGNHGNYQLDANTLKSDLITVDLANKKMIAPWGVGRRDAFISKFKKTPGVGWEYIISEDSTSTAAHTGDKLVIYVCGDQLTRETFDIEVQAPAITANMLLPKYNGRPSADYIAAGNQPWPRVTTNTSGIDSIWGPNGGVPYATRVDSLLELLEKPSNATWEVVYASGVAKPDLVDGDKIRVTSQNGLKKEYVVCIGAYVPSDNVDLRSITWPEIPEYYKGLFGWKGDTIPSFGQKTLNYNLEVPLVYDGIPALIGKTNDNKATIEVTRAKSLSGSMADRTTSFKVVAEDKTTSATYSVVLNKEVSYDNVPPYAAEPFFSEVVKNWNWVGTSVLEITNPGNQPLDLSDYMIINYGGSSLATGIMNNQINAYNMRYERYIPGYKWTASSATWTASPYLAEKDLSVNTIIQPGDVFTMGSTRGTSNICDNVWAELSSGNPLITQIDVEFSNTVSPCHIFVNQWGETTLTNDGMPMGKYQNNNIALLKITNDSVKRGLKPATDPDDFRAIDFIGGNGILWVMRGGDVTNGSPFSYVRKPTIKKGNPEPVASFGLKGVVDSEEWIVNDGDRLGAAGYGWPRTMLFVLRDVGKHYMIPATSYKSTVTSTVYKVSEGFTMKEIIRGVKQGTTVADFYNNIIKADTAQSLKVLSGAVELLDTDMLKNGDVLNVTSADSTYVSQYVLNVTAIGLSTDAIIKSSVYAVKTTVNPDGSNFGKGTIEGISKGTLLKDAIAKLVMPNFSSVNIINEKGAYVALKTLNYINNYVDVMVNQNIFIEVIAENGITGMVYQFMPGDNNSDAFITSNLFNVDQTSMLISLVPYGINVSNLMGDIIPSLNATYKVVDKMGFERQSGFVFDDDRVIVTSADKSKTATYFISRAGFDELNQIVVTNYFAYILSEKYRVDQVTNTVYGLGTSKSSVSEFMNNIVVSTGATAAVYTSSGVLKEAGSIIELTDVVKVALITGTLEVTYTFGINVGADQIASGHQYLVYPNPTNSNINVIGLMKGQKLSVYNFAGEKIMQLNADANHEQISLGGKPAGIYLIVISDNDKVVATFKTQKL